MVCSSGIPVFLGLAAMISIPGLTPHGFSAVGDSNYRSDVGAFFRAWYERNHRSPQMKPSLEMRCGRVRRSGNIVSVRRPQAGTNSGESVAIRDRGHARCKRPVIDKCIAAAGGHLLLRLQRPTRVLGDHDRVAVRRRFNGGSARSCFATRINSSGSRVRTRLSSQTVLR